MVGGGSAGQVHRWTKRREQPTRQKDSGSTPMAGLRLRRMPLLRATGEAAESFDQGAAAPAPDDVADLVADHRTRAGQRNGKPEVHHPLRDQRAGYDEQQRDWQRQSGRGNRHHREKRRRTVLCQSSEDLLPH